MRLAAYAARYLCSSCGLYTAGNTVQKNKFHMTKSFALPIITVNVAKISLDN